MEIVSRRRWRQYWPKWKLLYLWQIEKKLCRTSTGPFHTYMFDYLADPLVWRTLTFFVRGNITVWLTSCLTSQDLAKQANLFIVLTQQKSWIQTSQTGGQPYISPYKVSECSLTCSSPSTKELHVVGVCPLPSPRSYLRGRTLSRLNVRLKGIVEQSLTIVCRHHRDTGVRAATRLSLWQTVLARELRCQQLKTFSGQNLEIFFHRKTKKSDGFKKTFSSKVKFWQIIIVEGIKEAIASTSDLIILKMFQQTGK